MGMETDLETLELPLAPFPPLCSPITMAELELAMAASGAGRLFSWACEPEIDSSPRKRSLEEADRRSRPIVAFRRVTGGGLGGLL